jgi:Protein of unknown function (DUF669).
MSTINDFLGFDPNATEAVDTFEGRPDPVPEGIYEMTAVTAKRTNTKSGDGWFWFMEFGILKGEYEGRTVAHRFNIVNKNETAERIGRGQMKRFLDVIGVTAPENEDAMLGIAFLGSVKCVKGSFLSKSGEKIDTINNEITRLDPLGQATETKTQAPSQKKSQTADDETPPWGN